MMAGRALQILFAVISLTLVFSAFAVPTVAAAVVSVALVAALARSRDRWAMATVAVTLVFMVGVLELVLRVAGSDTIYYRDQEMFGRGDHYEPNVALRGFRQPYGDLYAISRFSTPTLVEPRTVDFLTDSLGNRNDRDYDGEALVLIGDSFGVANGTTQSETLAAALSAELGQRVYNASYPGAPSDYLRWRVRLEQQVGRASKTIFLFFEGNDLPCPDDDWTRLANADPWYLDVPGWIKPLATYRFSYGLIRRAVGTGGDTGGAVTVASVGGRDMGFFNLYLNATRATRACGWTELIDAYRAFAGSTALIAFAPTKYRVYSRFLDHDPETSLPHVRWQFVERLGREIGVPTLDLTPALTAEAERLLPESAYVYWRDDTHWNGHGTAVAAKAIAAALRAPPPAPVADPAPSALAVVRFPGVAASATDPDGWFAAGPGVATGPHGMTGDAASQIYRFLPVPANSRRMELSLDMAAGTDLGTILVDVIWWNGTAELARESRRLTGRSGPMATVRLPADVAAGADRLQLIVRPWRSEDGLVTVGGGAVSWY